MLWLLAKVYVQRFFGRASDATAGATILENAVQEVLLFSNLQEISPSEASHCMHVVYDVVQSYVPAIFDLFLLSSFLRLRHTTCTMSYSTMLKL